MKISSCHDEKMRLWIVMADFAAVAGVVFGVFRVHWRIHWGTALGRRLNKREKITCRRTVFLVFCACKILGIRYMNKSIIAGVALLAVSAAYGGTTTLDGVLPVGVNLMAATGFTSGGYSPFNNSVAGTLSLPRFDPVVHAGDPLATLTSVSYQFSYIIWNDWFVISGTAPTVTGVGQVQLNGPGGPLTDGFFYSLPVVSGSSGTVTHNDSSIPLNDGNLANYLGVGTADFTLQGQGSFGVLGNGSVDGGVTPYLGAYVELTYTWTTLEIPEPSTWAAIGFVGAIGGWTFLRSRKNKKA